MTTVAKLYGAILLVLGIGAYLVTGRASVTALIPAFFGLPVLVLAFLGEAPARRKVALHAVVVLAMLGFLGTVRGIGKLPALLGGETVERPAAVAVQSTMAVLSFGFLVAAFASFGQARRAGGGG